jgi:hypothetical protein
MGDFVVQMPSAARLTVARPNAKTKITTILVVFISSSFQSLILYAASAAPAYLKKISLIERHLDYLLQKGYWMRIIQRNIFSVLVNRKKCDIARNIHLIRLDRDCHLLLLSKFFAPIPPPNQKRIEPHTNAPKNSPIFARRRLQPRYNPKTPYLPIQQKWPLHKSFNESDL